MEYCCKGREGVCARHSYLAHHVNHDGLCLTHAELYLAAAIARTQSRAKLCVCLSHSESTHLYRSEAFDIDIAIRRYCRFNRFL